MSSPAPPPFSTAGPFAPRRDAGPAPNVVRLQAHRRRRAAPRWPAALGAAALVAGLVWLAQPRDPVPSREGAGAPPLALAAPPSPWQPLPRALPLYTFEAPDWRDLPQVQEARGHAGGGREDRLTVGGAGHPVWLRLDVTRGVPETAATSFFVDLVRRAAEAGLAVERSGRPEPVATKLGTLEAAAVAFQIAGPCRAFRFAHTDLSFRLRGWLCAEPGRAVGPAEVACAVNRLALVGGWEDPALRVFFLQADRRLQEAAREETTRETCGTARLAAAPS